jgi:hypothetical protein
MTKARFDAELFQGHKGVAAVIVPFDPEEAWHLKPVKLDARRDGWLVRGSVNGVRFDGYIGHRWGRFFIMLEPELRETAKVSIGDMVSVLVEPATTAMALAKARQQARVTTAPAKGRRDATAMPKAGVRRPARTASRER